MEETSVLDAAALISCDVNQHHAHPLAYLYRSHLTPPSGSSKRIRVMSGRMISILTCVRIPVKHSMSVNVTTASWDIDAVALIHGDDIIGRFLMIFLLFARSIVGV